MVNFRVRQHGMREAHDSERKRAKLFIDKRLEIIRLAKAERPLILSAVLGMATFRTITGGSSYEANAPWLTPSSWSTWSTVQANGNAPPPEQPRSDDVARWYPALAPIPLARGFFSVVHEAQARLGNNRHR